MSNSTNLSLSETYLLAKEIAHTVAKCTKKHSSFGDVAYWIIIFIFWMCIIVLLFTLVDFVKDAYWYRVGKKLPTGHSSAVTQILQAQLKDLKNSQLQALIEAIEKEQIHRKVKNEEKQIKSAGLEGIAVSRAACENQGITPPVPQVLFDAVAKHGREYGGDACRTATDEIIRDAADYKLDEHKEDDDGANNRLDEDYAVNERFEMVGAAEEGRALLSRG